MNETSTVVSPLEEGEILLDGKYRIGRVIGAGGMGVVVAATHVVLDERVALKFLLPAVLQNDEVVQRFAREARAAARLQSQHVVRVRDAGSLESGDPYMVMEHLEGTDLADLIDRHGPLRVRRAVDLVLEASEAIAEAHHRGIIHRDLKPANLFLANRLDGSSLVKVLDFGISKGMSEPSDEPWITATSAVLGSPMYMSPEQLRSSHDVDCRTDIWSLGVILFELVTGTMPFPGNSFAEACATVLHEPPVPLGSVLPDAPPGFELVIAKCLEKAVAHRFASVLELARALAPFGTYASAQSLDVIARWESSTVPAAPAPAPAAPAAVTPKPLSSPRMSGATSNEALTLLNPRTSSARPPRRRRPLAVVAGVSLALGVGGWGLLSSWPQVDGLVGHQALVLARPSATAPPPPDSAGQAPATLAIVAPTAASAAAPGPGANPLGRLDAGATPASVKALSRSSGVPHLVARPLARQPVPEPSATAAVVSTESEPLESSVDPPRFTPWNTAAPPMTSPSAAAPPVASRHGAPPPAPTQAAPPSAARSLDDRL